MTSPLFKSPIPLNYLDTDTALTANSDVKVPTQKAVKAYVTSQIPTSLSKASGAEVDTGTDDAKYVTPKAMEDSAYAKTTAIPVKASGAEVDTGTDDAKFVTAKAIADSNISYIDGVETYTNKTLTSPILQGLVDGWTLANETWTYASANTITIPSGGASKYAKGDKIRLKQGAGYKYFYIVGVADTTLTVTAGTDYTVATPTAITDNYYSHESSPIGFPTEFTCASPTWNTADVDNGTGGQQPTAGTNKFMIIGNKLYLRGAWGNTNVKKNGAGSTISTSAVPATLPNNASFFNLPCGISNPAGVNAIVTDRNTGEFRINANSSISDNTDMTYSGYTIDWFF